MALGTWEMVGQFTGTWLGATIMLATVPVVAVDGPLPFADVAWLYANARNTNRLRKEGGRIGAAVDDLLYDEAPAGESWSTSSEQIPVETPQVEIEFDKAPSRLPTFDKFLDFSEDFLPTNFDMDDYNFPQVDITPVMTLLNLATKAKAQWPQWNS
tara:strand:- start:1488 stop:1955 length:468 start_codon:yes stop_codon:yes gene_type:complete